VKAKGVGKLQAILAVLHVFEHYDIPVEHIPTSIDSFSVVVEKAKAGGTLLRH
jgi:hypothetical protein